MAAQGDEFTSTQVGITREMCADLATKADLANMASKHDLRFEFNALRADVASDLITTRLRVRRIEQRLDLQPEPH